MRRLRALVLAGAVVAVLGGCGSDDAGGDGEAPFDVPGDPVETTEVTLVKSYKFDPAVISVDAGATVTWTNEDDFPHNVTLLDGSDEKVDLPIGDSGTLKFDEAGTVLYQCSIHPQMHGKVVVG
jgi:plastocyanin